MKAFLPVLALPLLAGCVSLADYGEDPLRPRHDAAAYPGWWGRDAVSVSIFFGSLGPWGYWDRHPGFGQVWFPRGLAPGWQPYSRGYWVRDPRFGYRWVSHDPFGFATDHYGRWLRDPARGWYWVPGTRFQPGWTTPPPGWRPPANAGWRPPAGGRPQPGTQPGTQPPLGEAGASSWQPPSGEAGASSWQPPAGAASARAERRPASERPERTERPVMARESAPREARQPSPRDTAGGTVHPD